MTSALAPRVSHNGLLFFWHTFQVFYSTFSMALCNHFISLNCFTWQWVAVLNDVIDLKNMKAGGGDSFWGTQPLKSQPLGTQKPPCSTCYLCFSAVCHIITAVIKHIHHCSLPPFSRRGIFWTHFWKSFWTTSSELTASSAHTAKQWHTACPSMLFTTAGCCDMHCVSHHKMTKQNSASPGYLMVSSTESSLL